MPREADALQLEAAQTAGISPASGPAFRLRSVAEVLEAPSLSWLIADLLPQRGLCVLYGEPGSGKSFLAFDIAVHCAMGKRWAYRRTRRATMVYVALEGALRDRIEAYKLHHKLDDADLSRVLVVQGQQVNLLDAAVAQQLTVDIRAAVEPNGGPVIVVVDTLARAMPGGNENASEDMGAVIAACGVLERELGALVMLVHHAGKDATRGARGWSGLRGAADVEIQTKRDGDVRRATFAKVKDGADGVAVEFRLQVVDLGPRSDMDPMAEADERRTSCVAVLVDSDARPRPSAKALGRNQRLLLTALRKEPMFRHDAHAFMEKAGVPKRSRYDAIDGLLLAGLIKETELGLKVVE